MIKNFTATMTMASAVTASLDYGHYITDRDPKDGEHVVPGELRRFLARLRLLHGVPFSYLVPDAHLLPIESIRFFYIDRAWTDALTQGALSVGTISTADRTQLEAVYPHICSEVDETERTIRQPKNEEMLKAGSGTLTGLLLRSRAVSGWPNLHVRAYSVDKLEDDELSNLAESHPSRMKVLRLERLAPAVLLVIFDGVPAVVHIEEPRQGIQFGVRLDPEDPLNPALGTYRAKVKIRDNHTGLPVEPKDDFVADNSVNVPFRGGAPGVLNVTALRDRIKAMPKTNHTGPMEPNEFALQMLRFPFRQVFGDPDNTVGLQHYAIDKFVASVSMPLWKETVVNNLKVNGK
jgi:hypothetical protein